jgi:pimeloyl-ACP methyl ester carboxylesterase
MKWDSTTTFTHEGRTHVVNTLGGGEGPHFVLVHGIGVASSYFTRLAEVLARTGTVHAVELPGNGAAPEPQEPISVEQMAAHVGAYITANRLERPTVVGHSMGGQTVSELALQRPGHVPRIVLIGSVVDPAAPTAVGQGLRLFRDLFRETPGANRVVLVDYLRTGPRWYLKTLGAMMSYDIARTLPLLHADVLVLRGEHDPISSRPWSETMARLAPRGRMEEIAGAAHVAMFTHPDAVAALVVEHSRGGRSAPLDTAGLP